MEQVTVIVTGGGSGIGAACARRLAAEGASVVVTDINSANGRAIVAEIGAQALFVPLDVRDEAAWQTMLDQTQRRGGFGGLVNAAGVAHADDSLDRCTREVWDFTLRVNLDGVFLGTKHAILRMKVRGGSIVNIASVLANAGSADAMAYCASKGGVWLLTKSAAQHCAQKGFRIRVNSVHPGYIRTPMVGPFLASVPGLEAALTARHPLGRLGTAEEVAEVVLFLLSNDSRFVSGASLAVDGGYLAD
jgi:NAD(P)-dependent dehydrogenase (short-subunit alcohol dehydrogenase family)